jgi:IS30 family transposase
MMLPKPQQWTEAEVDHLKTLARRKVSAKDIAKALGRHIGSVKSKARELGMMPLKEAKG